MHSDDLLAQRVRKLQEADDVTLRIQGKLDMATPTALNEWLDQLSSSIVKTTTSSKQNQKRLQDGFRRRVKRHNFARTNQFEVAEKLDGLEEKFQILTLDNLSDALRKRRNELKEFQNNWLPDVLDLFFHLSGNPATNERLLELYRVPPRTGTPPPLRWKDLLADDPLDSHDRLWSVPDFRDGIDSGYEDEDQTVSTPASGSSFKRYAARQDHDTGVEEEKLLYELSDEPLSTNANIAQHSALPSSITEESFIRQALFLLQGLPVDVFTGTHQGYQRVPSVVVRGVPDRSLNMLADRISALRRAYDLVSSWVDKETDCAYIAAMKSAADGVRQDYRRHLDAMQQEFIEPTRDSTVSTIRLANFVEKSSSGIAAIARFLVEVGDGDSVAFLEKLYDATQLYQLSGDYETYLCLCSLLVPSLCTYLQPIRVWLEKGLLEADNEAFFVHARSATPLLPRLWHDQYILCTARQSRSPTFLASTASNVLACGKTSAFLSQFPGVHDKTSLTASSVIDQDRLLEVVRADFSIPFAAYFESNWHQLVSHLLQSKTESLKALLSGHCSLEETLDALGKLYLRQDSVLLDEIETKLFDRIDRCMDDWNDRFQLRDMLDEAFDAQGLPYVPNSIIVHSAYTSTRSMHNRRTSVKILNALALQYVLSWPLANIIDDDSMSAYQRVALVLMQTRRAKYCIERTGYLSAISIPLVEDASPSDQRFAQILAFALVNFVNTLYDHFMTTTLGPLTKSMRLKMRDASTMDAIIGAHKDYVIHLEYSCLAAPRVKVLRQTLISLLDLCIRFSDLVSNSAKVKHDDLDDEKSSFMSARSGNRTLREDQYGSDSEDDDDFGQRGEGYSSFIVLGDDTSIVSELRKVQTQFRKQVKFFIAGLRGVGKAGQHVHDLEQLADRLGWNQII